MRKSLLALFVASAAFAGAASAAPSDIYLGAGGQQSHLSSGALAQQNSTGIQLYGGYRMSPYFAVEAGLGYADGFRSAAQDKLKLREASVSVLGRYPLGKGFTAFGKVGVAYQQVKVADATFSGTNPVFGLGVEYGIDKHWGLRAEEDYLPRTADSSMTQSRFTLGVQYGF